MLLPLIPRLTFFRVGQGLAPDNIRAQTNLALLVGLIPGPVALDCCSMRAQQIVASPAAQQQHETKYLSRLCRHCMLSAFI